MGESFNNTSYLSLSKNEICHDISPNSTIIIYDYRENDDTPGDLDIIKDPILVMSQSAFLWPQKNHQRRFFSLGLRRRRLAEAPDCGSGICKKTTTSWRKSHETSKNGWYESQKTLKHVN
jgi:hypothetical protein